MGTLGKILALVRNRGRVRNALSTLASLYSADGTFDALGGLTEIEKRTLVDWAQPYDNIVEIGTLFGFTARALALKYPTKNIIAVDNFCWNPFGIPAASHRRFTETILENSNVKLHEGDAIAFLTDDLRKLSGRTLVFLDGDHRYEAVKNEIGLCRQAAVAAVSGHDWGNKLFGVTQAVNETLGTPDKTEGMIWLKKL